LEDHCEEFHAVLEGLREITLETIQEKTYDIVASRKRILRSKQAIEKEETKRLHPGRRIKRRKYEV
jgi:ribosomal protein L20A (L18A)